MQKSEILQIIEAKEFKYKIPVGFLEAVVKIESNFDVTALGAAGEIGLAQLLPAGAIGEYEKHFTPLDYWNPLSNLEVAAWYLGERIPNYLKHYKHEDSIRNRIICYNAGIGNLNKGIVPQSTRNYIAKVADYMKAHGKNGATATPSWVPGVILALTALGYAVTKIR